MNNGGDGAVLKGRKPLLSESNIRELINETTEKSLQLSALTTAEFKIKLNEKIAQKCQNNTPKDFKTVKKYMNQIGIPRAADLKSNARIAAFENITSPSRTSDNGTPSCPAHIATCRPSCP